MLRSNSRGKHLDHDQDLIVFPFIGDQQNRLAEEVQYREV
jgi:hypothetical protein